MHTEVRASIHSKIIYTVYIIVHNIITLVCIVLYYIKYTQLVLASMHNNNNTLVIYYARSQYTSYQNAYAYYVYQRVSTRRRVYVLCIVGARTGVGYSQMYHRIIFSMPPFGIRHSAFGTDDASVMTMTHDLFTGHTSQQYYEARKKIMW